jgi:hypothetical protein
MHPAIYLAVIGARETDLRVDRHQERPVREPRVRFPRRVAIRSRRLRAA